MINKIVHSIWLGDKMPDRILGFMKTIKDNNPGWSHIIWNEDMLSRFGIDVASGYDRFWSHASVSNWIRLMVVDRLGGIYLDADCECLKPLDGLLNHRAFAAEQEPGIICNAVFGAQPEHEWLKWQLDKLAFAHDPHDAAWGVYTMSESPKEGVDLIPSSWVYPFHYSARKDDRKAASDSIVVHHWDGSWSK